MNTPRPSSQWERINKSSLSDAGTMPLDDFKSGSANHKIAIWDPSSNGVRFLKELIYNLVSGLSPREWELLCAAKNRHVGSPYAITFNGELVCLDYLQAVYEVRAMEEHVRLKGASVVEIGAGYGRTCHMMLSNHDLAKYTIIDLSNALTLASRYLAAVLSPEEYEKIHFVPVEEFASLEDEEFDLCVNIDSFAEMDADVVHLYLSYIRNHCRNFFTKNPVGKYLDKSLDGHFDGNEAVQLALKSGILRDIIDIHDNQQVRGQAAKFVQAYSPGPEWECVYEAEGRPWSFYWQAAYARKK